MKKILLFPGCFDPFHLQHELIIKTLKKNKNYDEIWILLNKDSKEKKIISNFKHRLNIIDLNIKKSKKIKIIKKPIGFYTLEVIKKFKRKKPNFIFSLVLGSDQANNILNWKKSKNLNKLVKLVIIPRKNQELDETIKKKYSIETIKDIKINNFNSSEIRKGNSWNFLNEKTKKYILKNHLYFKNILKNNMSYKRIQHSIEVAKLSKNITKLFGYKKLSEKAYIAGLFHDLTKEWNEKKHINFLKKINIDNVFLKTIPFAIWHGKTSSLYLKHILKINDKDILNAINFHTTAKENMSILEKIIYIADKLEFSKTNLTFIDFKKKYKKNTLENIFIKVFKKQIQKFEKKNLKLTIDGKKAFNFYFNKK